MGFDSDTCQDAVLDWIIHMARKEGQCVGVSLAGQRLLDQQANAGATQQEFQLDDEPKQRAKHGADDGDQIARLQLFDGRGGLHIPVQLDVGEILMDFPLNRHMAPIILIKHGIHGMRNGAVWIRISHRDVFPAGRGKQVRDRFGSIWRDFYHEASVFL